MYISYMIIKLSLKFMQIIRNLYYLQSVLCRHVHARDFFCVLVS